MAPALLLALAGSTLVAPTASARPVTATDFQIRYWFTEEDGSHGDQLRASDLNYYINRARCECNEQLTAEITLQRSMDEAYDDAQIRTYVGSQCDLGQDNFGPMNRPCAEVFVGQPNDYDDGGVDVIFDTVWLSSRTPSLEDQGVPGAEPLSPCAGTQAGEAGVWICAEDGMQTDCQSSEFIISGTQNQNNAGATDPSTGANDGAGSGGLVFDYLPPQATVTGFSSSPGDGAVVVSWERTESTQINGFRVLCATMDGAPVEGKGASPPPFSQRTDGKFFYTASNLCPGEQVYFTPDDEAPPPVEPTDDTGGSTGGGSDDGRDTDGTTGVGADAWLGDEWALGGSAGTSGGSSDTGFGTTGATDGSSSGGMSTGGMTTTGGETTGDATGGGGGSALDSELASLSWDYICSDHITGTGTSARIDGLQNGVPYQFIVVAYDRAGNPLIVSDEVLVETPEQTTDFWERCEMQGDLCGEGGFCHCSIDEPQGAAWLGSGLMLLVMLGLRTRRAR